MGIVERRLRQKDEVRTSILQAAWQLVLSEGWSALSIRKIAEAIEYSVPVIYAHFASKEAILEEFTKEGFRQLTRAVIHHQDEQQLPTQRLKSIAQGYWQFALTHKEYYQIMFGLGIPPCNEVDEMVEMKQFADLIQSLIEEALPIGEHPPEGVTLKFFTYWSILHGLVSIQLNGLQRPGSQRGELVLNDAIDGFIKGLTT